MGAAGLTSSVAEMAYRAGQGIDFFVDKVPRREAGMTPLEVMLSESQERMVLVPKPGKGEELLKLLERWELEAVIVGEVASHGMFRLLENGEVVGDMPVAALNEAPTYTREGIEDEEVRSKREQLVEVNVPEDLEEVLLSLLSSPTIASRRPVFERYDYQVMTNTVVLPGQADAAVLRIKGSNRGIAMTVDCNPRYCYLDPYEGAKLAVAEAARNLACVGATPLAITDNLNFGNPTRPDVYYQMERAVEGLKDACLALGTPVTGGNVSLYNQYRASDGLRAVHPTPNVGMVGVLPDVTKRATQGFKRDGDVVLLIGENTDDDMNGLGASEYLARWHGLEIGHPPELNLERAKTLQVAVSSFIQQGLCDTAHDLSEGGLAVALAEMVISGQKGVTVTLKDEVRADALLFGEAQSRVLLALKPEDVLSVETLLTSHKLPFQTLGEVGGDALRIEMAQQILTLPLDLLTQTYSRPLEEALT